MKIVVFDFDGTLSYKDSMEELFKHEMIGIKKVFYLYYFILKILAKFKLISVKFEKERMIKLLFHSNVELFAEACRKLAEDFTFNPVFLKLQGHIIKGDRVIVLSASSIYFLKKIFSDISVELLCTTFKLRNSQIIGIECHPFYKEKVKCLKKNGIEIVDDMYYDSKWDECLIPMCRQWHKVKNGYIISSNQIV